MWKGWLTPILLVSPAVVTTIEVVISAGRHNQRRKDADEGHESDQKKDSSQRPFKDEVKSLKADQDSPPRSLIRLALLLAVSQAARAAA